MQFKKLGISLLPLISSTSSEEKNNHITSSNKWDEAIPHDWDHPLNPHHHNKHYAITPQHKVQEPSTNESPSTTPQKTSIGSWIRGGLTVTGIILAADYLRRTPSYWQRVENNLTKRIEHNQELNLPQDNSHFHQRARARYELGKYPEAIADLKETLNLMDALKAKYQYTSKKHHIKKSLLTLEERQNFDKSYFNAMITIVKTIDTQVSSEDRKHTQEEKHERQAYIGKAKDYYKTPLSKKLDEPSARCWQHLAKGGFYTKDLDKKHQEQGRAR